MKIGLIICALILCVVSNVLAAPILWTDNNHYYDFVGFSTSPLTWQEAFSVAENSSYLGFPGHLVTITSSDENGFLNANFYTAQSSQFVWIGGNEPNDDDVWRWATGPEINIQFSYWKTPTAPFNYANWGGIEPNDHKPLEDYAMFNIGLTFATSIGRGQWADAEPWTSSLDPVVGYLVEYEPTQAPIPEPASLSLLGLGLLGLVFRRKKTS